MDILNGGVEVAGRLVTAQVSQPKERHAKPKEEELHDMRLRRQRFEATSADRNRGPGITNNHAPMVLP